MPAVAGGNRDRVHVFARQQISEIGVGGAILVAVAGVHFRFRGFQPVGPAIAHCEVLDFGKGEESRQGVQGAVADADGAEDNAIARGDRAGQTKHRAGNDQGQGGGSGDAFQELTAV